MTDSERPLHVAFINRQHRRRKVWQRSACNSLSRFHSLSETVREQLIHGVAYEVEVTVTRLRVTPSPPQKNTRKYANKKRSKSLVPAGRAPKKFRNHTHYSTRSGDISESSQRSTQDASGKSTLNSGHYRRTDHAQANLPQD